MAQQTCTQFVPSSNTNTSSETICAYCGLKKFAHNDDVRNMAQTSVEWMAERFRDTILTEYAEGRFLELIEEAKEMYNIELGNAYEEGWKDASKEAMKEIHKYQ